MAILIIISVIILIGVFHLVGKAHPVFGGKLTRQWIQLYEQSKQWKGNQFEYPVPTNSNLPWWKIPVIIYKQFSGQAARRPLKNMDVLKPTWTVSQTNSFSSAKLLWFGHSTFLIEMAGKTILIDPMFGQVPAPHRFLGNTRFHREMPIDPDQLPPIDILIMSHDHYDHLDYASILKIKHKVKHFLMPLGMKRHFIRWGVPDHQVMEMDWWQGAEYSGLKLVCTPARHFSGRGVGDHSKSLWCSWILKNDHENLFFSGDSGYGPHFKEIGDQYGPFDFAMIECGQYYKDWPLIHLSPEEAAQASLDLKATVMMPIHWGAFTLAFHSWTEPIERLLAKAKELNVKVSTPRIGEVFLLNQHFPESRWWE